jgi:hypothetical protein
MALRRHQRIHLQNVRIAVCARRHHFDARIGVPFLCECDDEDCHEFVVVRLRDFDKIGRQHLTLVAAGHSIAGALHAGRGDGYELYRFGGEAQATG